MREVELPLGARDADVEEPALLLEQRGIVVRLREREQTVLETADEHDRELQSLGVVQRHERHGVGVGIERVELGDQRGALQEVVERREPDLPFLVGDGLGGARRSARARCRSVGRSGPSAWRYSS